MNNDTLYRNILPGTLVYQNRKGGYLPEENQPGYLKGEYVPHISTRYKNVIVSENGIQSILNINTGLLEKTEKPLPELYRRRDECCGCTACYTICPVADTLPNRGKDSVGLFGEIYTLQHGAIYMEQDEEGFYYPVVDAHLCVRCYKCIRVCPMKNADA